MQILSIERWHEGAHFVKKHTNAPYVRLVVVCVALHDLWAEVVRRSNYCGCHLSGRLEYACDSKITKFDNAVLHQENVLSFDVAVQDLSVVAVLESEANLGEPAQDLVFTEVVLCY